MRRTKNVIAGVALIAALRTGSAQVISPPEIRDPQLRELQQKHLADLKAAATAISAHSFPYRLYFGRTLDLDETEQPRRDQRSIRFDKFRGMTVVEITANYYASYSAELMQPGDRARRTLDDVVVPMLQAAIPAVIGEEKVQGFAIEVSHHVRKKVLGVSTENPENVAFVLPRAAALRLIAASTPGEREAALMEGMLFVNRDALDGWGPRNGEMFAETQIAAPRRVDAKPHIEGEAMPAIITPLPAEPQKTPTPAVATARPEVSRESLGKFQSTHQESLDRLVRELDKEAHFVSYAPPTFIQFRKGAYLQLSMTTTLQEKEGGSQYRLAALAFDEHISHLIRPVLASLKTRPDFDGINFSTSVRLPGMSGGAVAVEFVFPTNALVAYQDYDCTGQQLINLGFVLINGERVSLELQGAEANVTAQH